VEVRKQKVELSVRLAEQLSAEIARPSAAVEDQRRVISMPYLDA
jgi:hypothetical protein